MKMVTLFWKKTMMDKLLTEMLTKVFKFNKYYIYAILITTVVLHIQVQLSGADTGTGFEIIQFIKEYIASLITYWLFPTTISIAIVSIFHTCIFLLIYRIKHRPIVSFVWSSLTTVIFAAILFFTFTKINLWVTLPLIFVVEMIKIYTFRINLLKQEGFEHNLNF